MKKSTKHEARESMSEYSEHERPRNDMTEFRDQVFYRRSLGTDVVDDTNPEYWLHKISLGMEVGI